MRRVTRLAVLLAVSLFAVGCRSSSSGGTTSGDAGAAPSREARCDACDARCEPDAAQACFELGVAHETGDGAPQDLARARALWDRAARAGHAGARAKIRAHWGGI